MTDTLANKENGAVKNTRSTWYKVDATMLPSKLSYAFKGATEACHMPYMNLFLLSAGLSAVQAGQVTGLRYIGAIVGAPLLGVFADMKKRHRLGSFEAEHS